MPIFDHAYLHRVSSYILLALGASEHEANVVSNHVVKANLVGHDSHGVLQLPIYADRIKKSHIIPGAPFNIENESPTSARINGNWGFGYVVTEEAMKLAIEKARLNSVSAITVYQQGHIGRLGDYVAMAAQEGMIGLITADSGRGPKAVAPFGGRERKLGTNPIAMAVPSDLEGAVVLDMATSAVAEGKIRLANSRRETIPSTWIVDKYGNASTDPQDYFDGGAILPVGADQGHKGYGLSFMVEVFSGLLTGLGFGVDPQARHNDGCFISVFNVEAFRPLDDFKREIQEFIDFIKASPLSTDSDGIFYPGEFEWRTEQERLTQGIFVEDDTWQQLWRIVEEHDLASAVGKP